MLYQIPIKPVPNQNLSFVLGGQEVSLSLTTRYQEQLYMSINVNGSDIVINRLCLNLIPLITVDYLPMKGNLVFLDKEGNSSPHYTGLGSRYLLVYSDD